jgi:N-acetylglucosaminyldiphosphoundecaprenol N-acetyl-beta-D-mannosaminyltransferase
VLLVGVGAAFDVLAGMRRDAPGWMKRAGLQWLHRLAQEPRRLGPRYLRIVPGFLWRALPDLLFGKRSE